MGALKCTVNNCCKAEKGWMSTSPTQLGDGKCKNFPEKCAMKNCGQKLKACQDDEKCHSSMEFCVKHTNNRDEYAHCADQEPMLKAAMKCVADNCCRENQSILEQGYCDPFPRRCMRKKCNKQTVACFSEKACKKAFKNLEKCPDPKSQGDVEVCIKDQNNERLENWAKCVVNECCNNRFTVMDILMAGAHDVPVLIDPTAHPVELEMAAFAAIVSLISLF